jgi:hypothetical protein
MYQGRWVAMELGFIRDGFDSFIMAGFLAGLIAGLMAGLMAGFTSCMAGFGEAM